MSLSVKCGGCGTTMSVDDRWAGQQRKCKSCGTVVNVPAACSCSSTASNCERENAAQADASKAATAAVGPATTSRDIESMSQEIAKAFDGQLAKIRTPLIVGCILVVFMFKPLFARPPRRPRTRSLTRDGEPLLFDFADRVCHAVRAPRPRRIDVDCEVNASASFRRGFWSMIVGNDLVLTIGMPLVTGLNA